MQRILMLMIVKTERKNFLRRDLKGRFEKLFRTSPSNPIAFSDERKFFLFCSHINISINWYIASPATVVWTKMTLLNNLCSDAVRSCAADFVKEHTLWTLVIASYTSVAKIFGYFSSLKSNKEIDQALATIPPPITINKEPISNCGTRTVCHSENNHKPRATVIRVFVL